MAGLEKHLNVPWYGQATLYFCGPAVAQMFLEFFGVIVSQPDLWEDIKNNSGGSRPPDAPSSGHEFPEQVCDNCEPNPALPPKWECWDTTPEALKKTIEARKSGVALRVRYSSLFDDATSALIESLDRSSEIPPLATLSLVNHWVLVNGYLRDDSASIEMPPVTVGKYNLNGLYILDPQQPDPDVRVKLISTNDWRAQFGLIGCGPLQDRYPVVVGENPRIAWWVWLMAVFVLIVVWMIARWLV